MSQLMRLMLAALLALTEHAHAQQPDLLSFLEDYAGTISVSFVAGLAEGELTGCYLEFEHLQRDGLYLAGNFIRTSGSLGLMAAADSAGFVMKAVAKEVDAINIEAAPKQLTLSRVYLVGADHSTNFKSLVASWASDTPGGVFSVFQLDPGMSMLLEALTNGEVTVAIAIGDGSSDIQLPIRLMVQETADDGQRTESNAASVDFSDCAQSLLASQL